MPQNRSSLLTLGLLLLLVLLVPIVMIGGQKATSNVSQASERPVGDVNGDGRVDLNDAAAIRIAITNHTYSKEADLNHDGVVDEKDLAAFYDLISR